MGYIVPQSQKAANPYFKIKCKKLLYIRFARQYSLIQILKGSSSERQKTNHLYFRPK